MIYHHNTLGIAERCAEQSSIDFDDLVDDLVDGLNIASDTLYTDDKLSHLTDWAMLYLNRTPIYLSAENFDNFIVNLDIDEQQHKKTVNNGKF